MFTERLVVMNMKTYKKQSTDLLKVLGLINYIEEYIIKYIIMPEENRSQKIRLKNIDQIRNYLTEQINWNELMNKKQKKVCTALNYIEHFLSYFSFCNYWICSHFCFWFFNCYSYQNYEFCNRIKNLCINWGIKNYKSIIKKKKKKHKKNKLIRIEALVSKALIG